nr:unnamed protein product [Callosobruchus analis]
MVHHIHPLTHNMRP